MHWKPYDFTKKSGMKINRAENLSQLEVANIYDDLFKGEGRLRDSDSFYNWVLDRLHPDPGCKLLDVACGEGLLIKAARERGVNAIGIDLSAQAAKLSVRRLGVQVVAVANGEKLPFQAHSFDYVTNIGSLEHFFNPSTGIQEMKRIMKPGGRAAYVLPNSYYLVDLIWQVWRTGYGPSHKQPMEMFATFREWWELLEKHGMQVNKAYKYNFCFPRTRGDYRWYRQHPKKILNLLLSPIIPFNFSNHFLYICSHMP